MIQAEITKQIRSRMKVALQNAGSREIGGILMGQEVAQGHFIVVDFSLDDVSGERAHFVRDVEHHKKALDEFFDRTGHDYKNFNYLGEWHSHPKFSVQPSTTDKYSMQDLVEGERDIDFAVLLIVKLSFFRRFISYASLHQRGFVPEPIKLIY